ncbi:hypothetical protein Tco_0468677 [Tanacetum coccineum]
MRTSTVIDPKLPIIDMAELVRLQICAQFDDTWSWVAIGPGRTPDAAAGAPTAPQQPPPPPHPAARTVPQRLGRLEEDVKGLRRDVGSLRGLVERLMDRQGRFLHLDDEIHSRDALGRGLTMPAPLQLSKTHSSQTHDPYYLYLLSISVREELCEDHEIPVCNIRRYMIKYSFNNNEEYVAVKEGEYDDLTITREKACRAYQEIFRIMDEGWMVTRAE